MRNSVVVLIFGALAVTAVLIGLRAPAQKNAAGRDAFPDVPHIGRIQILNGCGHAGVAKAAVEAIRRKGFDVKNDGIGNAPTFNYPLTLVVSRTKDMTIAHQVGAALALDPDRVVLLRNGDERFDATVFLGADREGKPQ